MHNKEVMLVKQDSMFFKKVFLLFITLGLIACGFNKQETNNSQEVILEVPSFNADTAYYYIEQQCKYGARVPGSEAHQKIGNYIEEMFQKNGLEVSIQEENAKAFNGHSLKVKNIIAKYNSKAERRVLICSHWDSRPWADNDKDTSNHKLPVMGANDGASGVAVMLALAQELAKDSLSIGVDFVAFDAEDYGMPYWEEEKYKTLEDNGWCIGSTLWAEKMKEREYRPLFGVLLDMVGGEDARFYQEGFSLRYASGIVNMFWETAKKIGFGSYFIEQPGGYITDDHEPINRIANIPCIDIIPYYPNNVSSSFGPTWHTIYDTPENISVKTLKAVGQTLLQVIYDMDKI